MALMDRIRALAPQHQLTVYETVMAQPSLKQAFYGGSGYGKGSTQSERSTLLANFEQYAAWTIPAAFPEEGMAGIEMQMDYQSLGAQAVTNLANKIVTTMYHPSRPFFKTQAPQEYIQVSGKSKSEIELELTGVEQKCMEQFARRDGRTVATDSAIQAIITGNSLWHMPKGKPYRHFTYRDYDATFDSFGDVQTCTVREWLFFDTLATKHKEICAQFGKKSGETVEVFTGIKRMAGDYYVVWQEIENYCVLSEDYGVYHKDNLEYLPQRWSVMPGRHAGVGLIEMMAGDFHTMSKMHQAELDLLAIMCDVKTVVKPGFGTDVAALNAAPPGSYVSGDVEGFKSHVHNVANQCEFISNKSKELARRISQMFLLNQNSIRDAERVTAEEIRYLASELDQVHGGAYSRYARTQQKPVAYNLLINESTMLKDFEPLIVTGLESLSRMSELDNWRGFLGDVIQIGNALNTPGGAWINLNKMTTKFAAGWGIDPAEVMYTPKEKAAEEQRILEQQAALAAANELPKQAGV